MAALIGKGARFGLVGLATLFVYFAVLFALRPILDSVVLLSASAYLASAVFNYIAQARVTFRAYFADLGTLGRYLIMHAGCMTLNSTLMFLLVERWTIDLFLAQCMVTFIVAGLSFQISNIWVYRARE